MKETDYSGFQDEQLSALLKQGDPEAFTEIFNRYTSLLYIHAYNKLRNETEAREVVQEMFVRLWDKREAIDEGNNLSGYLYRSVMNGIFNLIKHKKVVTVYAEAFYKTPRQTAGTDHLIREKQLQAYIQTEIENLPPRMREVFKLRRNDYLSNKEVAERLNITESTAADQMKKALKILRSRLGAYFIFM